MNHSLSSHLFSLGGLSFSWSDVLLLSTVVASWLAMAVALYCLRQARRQNQESLALVQDLNRDLQVAGRGAIGMGQRIIALERKLIGQGQADSHAGQSAEIKPFSATLKAVTGTARLRAVPDREAQADKVTLNNKTARLQEESAPTCFDDASQLLAEGMDVDEVANRCGLTRSEAALMAMLQRQKGVVAAL